MASGRQQTEEPSRVRLAGGLIKDGDGADHRCLRGWLPLRHRGLRLCEYEEYRRTTRGSRSAAPFEGTHETTQHKVKVAKRSDRQPLVSIYEQQKQNLQVAISWFEGETDEAREAAAIVFMVDLATQYCQALVTKEELKTKRDQGVHDLKLQKKKKSPGVLKRPAANILKRPATEAINVEDTEEKDAEEKDAEKKPAEVMATTLKKRPAGKSSVKQPSSKRPAAAQPAAALAAEQAAAGDGAQEHVEIEDDLFLTTAMPEPELGDIGCAFASLL